MSSRIECACALGAQLVVELFGLVERGILQPNSKSISGSQNVVISAPKLLVKALNAQTIRNTNNNKIHFVTERRLSFAREHRHNDESCRAGRGK